MSRNKGEVLMTDETGNETTVTQESVDTGVDNTATGGNATDTVTDGNEGTAPDNNTADNGTVDSVLNFDTLKLPEGMSVSEEEKAQFMDLAKKVGIKDPEGLQGFADWVLETSKQSEAEQAQAEENAKKEWEQIKSGWKETLQKDADFGKEYDLNIKRANDAMVKFGGSELTDWLKSADLAEHPALLKTFARIGKEIEDAKILTGSSSVEVAKVKRDRYNNPMISYKE
jgi:hypothetical protein